MGKSSSAVTGYRYKLSVVMWLQEGAVDEILQIKSGERDIWVYDPSAPPYSPLPGPFGVPQMGVAGGDHIRQNERITDDKSVFIRAYQVHGGDGREGGLWGVMSVHMGKSSTPDTFLASNFGPDTPAYVGVTSLVFKNFIWSGNNPYFKPLSVLTRCLNQNWRGDVVWYPEKIAVGPFDMNPAHMIYQLITSPRYNMAWPTGDIDDASFRAAADQFYAEGFGLSGIFNQDVSVEEFVQIIASTVNCELRLGETTGKFELVLIRDNYDVNDLTELNPDNIVVMTSFERAGYGELGNTLTVMYTDREQVLQPYTMNDQSAITKQGGQIIPVTREYPLIREPSLAARVCARDLTLVSGTLAKAVVTTDRVLHKHQKGDVIALTLPRLGLVRAPFRILEINKKSVMDGTIDIQLVEDVFGLPNNSYVGQESSQWTDPSGPPVEALHARTDEMTYRDIRRYLPSEQFDTLAPDYCFGRASAVHAPGSYFNFKLFNSETVDGYYAEKATGDFCAFGVLTTELTETSVTMQLSGIIDAYAITVGEYAIVGEEWVIITAYDVDTNTFTIGRGTVDTVPAKHAAGTQVWFPETNNAVDRTQRLPGTTTYYKVLPTTGYGVLRSDRAAPIDLEFVGRAQMPYPPGNLKFNAVAYPEYIKGALTVSWSHRNRITQADQLVPTTTLSIAPEIGTYYRMVVHGENGGLISETDVDGDAAVIDESSGAIVYDAAATGDRITLVGMGLVSSPAATTLAANLIEPLGGYATTFSPAEDGYLYFSHLKGEFIDGTTGVKTTRNRATPWQTDTNEVIINRNPSTYVAGLGFNNDNQIISYDPYVGWALVGSKNFDTGVVTPLGLSASDGLPFTLKDRRPNSRTAVAVAMKTTAIRYWATTYLDMRPIRRWEYRLHKITKNQVLTGPLTSTSVFVSGFYLADPAQFNSAEGYYTEFGPISSGRMNYAYMSSPFRYARLGVIFGSLLYLPYLASSASFNTSGKAINITNILAGHIDCTTAVDDATAVYSIDLDGNFSPIATRSGLVLADQVSATQGMEVINGTITTVNSSTGALGSVLATLPGGTKALRVAGDPTSETFYVLAEDGKVYRYNLTGVLLSEIQLPTSYTPTLPTWLTLDNGIQMEVSAGGLYILTGMTTTSVSVPSGGNTRAESPTYKIAKDLSEYSQVSFAAALSSLGAPGQGAFTMKTNPSSSVILKGTLVDESSAGNVITPVATPRLNETLTVTLGSRLGSLDSFQKHVNVVPRRGYGLRYDESYEV